MTRSTFCVLLLPVSDRVPLGGCPVDSGHGDRLEISATSLRRTGPCDRGRLSVRRVCRERGLRSGKTLEVYERDGCRQWTLVEVSGGGRVRMPNVRVAGDEVGVSGTRDVPGSRRVPSVRPT